MKKNKICHVITRMIIGGAQENTLFTVEGLAQKPGYEVTLVSGPQTGPEGDLKSKIQDRPSFHLVLEPSLRRNIHPFFDGLALWRLYRFFKREQFDIVHTHSSKAGILGRVAAWAANVPLIIHTIHGLPFHAFQNRFVNRIYERLERFCASLTRKIITVAEAMSEQAVRAGVADAQKFVCIRSGMDLTLFLRRDYDRSRIRQKWGLSGSDIVIGKVARLFHLKGHEYLIQAAPKIVKEFPKVKFLLIGDGLLKESLQEKIRDMKLENHFVFGGLVQPQEIPETIAVMDIVVHVSLREGLAKVLPQALASGKPVISFDLDGAREVVRDGVNGFLVSPCDSLGLSEALLKLLRDPALCEKMSAQGPRVVDPYFRKEYMVDKIDELYRSLLGQNKVLE